jgi:hypothetical protein
MRLLTKPLMGVEQEFLSAPESAAPWLGGVMRRPLITISTLAAACALATAAPGMAATPFTPVSFTSLTYLFVEPASPLCHAGFSVQTTWEATPTGRLTEVTNILGQPLLARWQVVHGTQIFTCPDGSSFTLAFNALGYRFCYSLGCIQEIYNFNGHWRVAGGTGAYANLVGGGSLVVYSTPVSGIALQYTGKLAFIQSSR